LALTDTLSLDIDIDIYFRFHKSKLASRPLDIEHVKYTDTTEQKTTKHRQIK
jgi:hypothetical protein